MVIMKGTLVKGMKRFKTIEELYNTILPALKSKCQDLHLEKYVLIKEDDIWEYLIAKKWINNNDLDLPNVVDDILNVNGSDVSKFIKESKH